MERPIILVVDSDVPRLARRRRLVEELGAVPLLAPTLARARFLLSKLRITAVVTAAHLDDGGAASLWRAMRERAAHAATPLVALGPLCTDEHGDVLRDPHVRVCERTDALTVLTVLESLLVEHTPDPSAVRRRPSVVRRRRRDREG